MQRLKTIFIFTAILSLALQACNLQLVEGAQGAGDELLLTITAQALILEQAGWTATPTVAAAPNQVIVYITATEDGAASATPEVVIPAAILPPATGPVTVTVSTATNCRSGPGQSFASLYGMPVGQVAKVVAKNSYSGYWIIEIPGQNGQTCWLWGQYATINGDTASLKDVVTPTSVATKKPTATNTAIASATATATSTATTAPVLTKPNAPVITSSSVVCTDQNDGTYKYEVTLQWTDNSNNETAFEIALNPIVNGGQTAGYGLPQDTTFFVHQAILPTGTAFTSSVFAQNNAGNSSTSSATVVCPIGHGNVVPDRLNQKGDGHKMTVSFLFPVFTSSTH